MLLAIVDFELDLKLLVIYEGIIMYKVRMYYFLLMCYLDKLLLFFQVYLPSHKLYDLINSLNLGRFN